MYGIVGAAPETEKQIRAIKGRGQDRPFIMLIAKADWIKPYSTVPLPASLARFWPGPLTILFPRRDGEGKVAFRVPADPFLRQILKVAGKPLYSTSVNEAGEDFLWKFDDIVLKFGKKVDCIVDAGNLPESCPSTIVDIGVKPFRVVRQGKLIIPSETLKAR
jgi:L-threonylcarbamoyladenylate synthase